MQSKAIVLISGGMDSAVTLACAIRDGYEVSGLHVNYGQRTEKKEMIAFNELCDHFKIENRLVIDISYLTQIGGSSLTDKNIEVSKANLNTQSIPSSYVPFRNANILSIATAWAEVVGAEALFIGAMEEDSSGYPDTRRVFFDSFENTIKLGTKPDSNIKILTPIISNSKAQIVKLGADLKVPFEKTWSCYKEDDVACGECDSCALRLRGFNSASIEDPIPYKTRPNY